MADDELHRRRLRRLPRSLRLLAARVGRDPRRLPDQHDLGRSRDQGEVDRLADPRAAGRRRDRRRRRRPPRGLDQGQAEGTVDEARREGDREGARRQRAVPRPAREHRRHPGPARPRLRRARAPDRAPRRRRAGRGLPRLLPPVRVRLRHPRRRRVAAVVDEFDAVRSDSTGCAASTSTTRRSASARTAIFMLRSARARSGRKGSRRSSPSRGSRACPRSSRPPEPTTRTGSAAARSSEPGAREASGAKRLATSRLLGGGGRSVSSQFAR